jgi:cell division protein FtsW (lipid II flippase)
MDINDKKKHLLSLFLRTCLLILIGFTGFVASFLSQASSPNYHRLFWGVLPYTGVNFIFVAVYFLRYRDWSRWVVVCIAFVTLLSIAEFALRIWS